jgi:hypothetical protein
MVPIMPLPADMTVPIQVAALMEAALNHAQSDEIKRHGQGAYKHGLRNLEPARDFSYRRCRLRIRCHLCNLSANSGARVMPIRIAPTVSTLGRLRPPIIPPS